MTPTIQELAREAARCFERARRETIATSADGSDRETHSYLRVREGSPDWVRELVRDAHGDDFLPDDWRYLMIAGALDAIGEAGDDELDDVDHSYADGAASIYTSELLAWFSSNLRRPSYCDEAVEELGDVDGDILSRVKLGQYWEAREVAGLVRQTLEHRQAELAFDEADDAGETLAAYAPGHEPAELPGEAIAAERETAGDPPYSNAGGSHRAPEVQP